MEDLKAISYVLRGTARKRFLKALKKGQKTTVQIREATGIHKSHLRRTIKELEAKRLVRCLTPKEPYHKFYTLTPLGRKVVRKVR